MDSQNEPTPRDSELLPREPVCTNPPVQSPLPTSTSLTHWLAHQLSSPIIPRARQGPLTSLTAAILSQCPASATPSCSPYPTPTPTLPTWSPGLHCRAPRAVPSLFRNACKTSFSLRSLPRLDVSLYSLKQIPGFPTSEEGRGKGAGMISSTELGQKLEFTLGTGYF